MFGFCLSFFRLEVRVSWVEFTGFCGHAYISIIWELIIKIDSLLPALKYSDSLLGVGLGHIPEPDLYQIPLERVHSLIMKTVHFF
jgi:hypothetical protein